jgi:hypothetical protein
MRSILSILLLLVASAVATEDFVYGITMTSKYLFTCPETSPYSNRSC